MWIQAALVIGFEEPKFTILGPCSVADPGFPREGRQLPGEVR